MKAEEEAESNRETENQALLIDAILVEQMREMSRGRIHDMPRWME